MYWNYYDTPYPAFWLSAVLLAATVALIAVAAVFYVFQALGLSAMAKRRGLSRPWLAWIPVASAYLMGKIADQYSGAVEQRKTNYALILLLLSIITTALSVCIIVLSSVFGQFYSLVPTGAPALLFPLLIASTVSTVFYYLALYRLYNWFSGSSALLTVLSFVFAFIIPFVLFSIRKGSNPLLSGLPQTKATDKPSDA